MDFEYIIEYYGVPAEMFREVVVGGKKGVITKDLGNYIGVVFYDDKNLSPLPCHPTSEVKYLDYFNQKPPKTKNHRSKERYQKYLEADGVGSFREWLGIRNSSKP